MSGPTHFVFGFGLGLLFYFLTERKFSARHVIIFGINNWYGPDFGVILCRVLDACGVNSDLAWAIGVETIHSYIFWPFFALLMTWPWHAWFKWELHIPKRGQNIWTKLDRSPLSFVQTFKLIVAGGYLHFFVDDTLPVHYFAGRVLSLGVWKGASIHWSLLITGFITFIYVFLLIWFLHSAYWTPRKQWNNLFRLFLLYIVANTALFTYFYITTGVTMAVGDEIDYGLNIWLLVMFFAPLYIAASTVPVSTNKSVGLVTPSDKFMNPNLIVEPAPSFLQENRFILIMLGVVLFTYLAFFIWNPDLIQRMI